MNTSSELSSRWQIYRLHVKQCLALILTVFIILTSQNAVYRMGLKEFFHLYSSEKCKQRDFFVTCM